MIILKARRQNVIIKIKANSIEEIKKKLNTIKEISVKDATQKTINKELTNNGFGKIEWII